MALHCTERARIGQWGPRDANELNEEEEMAREAVSCLSGGDGRPAETAHGGAALLSSEAWNELGRGFLDASGG